jgi:hypothetical protein
MDGSHAECVLVLGIKDTYNARLYYRVKDYLLYFIYGFFFADMTTYLLKKEREKKQTPSLI